MFEKLLSERGLSLDWLKNFCDFVSEGSIARAAGGELTRQSLYSRQIGQLEEFFGVELTRRKGKGLEITNAGHRLAEAARAQMQALEDFKHECAGEPVDFRIAAGNSILEWLLIPQLAQIRSAIGDQRIHLFDMRSRDVISGLTDHTLDFGVVRKSAVVTPLKFRPLAELGYALFYPEQWKASDLKNGLDKLPLALPEGGEFADAVRSFSAKRGLKLNIIYHCTSLTQAAQLVRMGVSGAILPKIAAPSLGKSVKMMEIPWFATFRRQLGIVWHQRLVALRPKTELLLEALSTMK